MAPAVPRRVSIALSLACQTANQLGMRCVQLDNENRCKIFGQPERPAFCASLQPSIEMCHDTREQAMIWLANLERLTKSSIPGLRLKSFLE